METTTIRERVAQERHAFRAAPSKPLSICLLGQPYWVKELQDSLNASSRARVSAFRLRLGSRHALADLRKVLSADVLVRMGFRPGARTVRGRAFDTLWAVLRLLNLRAAAVFYWLGTDVFNTIEDFNSGKLRRRCYNRSKQDDHLADAPWLAKELAQIGITAFPITVTLPSLSDGEPSNLPTEFSVLTYIPDARYQFYGGECIYRAAQQLPNIRFDVVGGLGAWVPEALPNLVFQGWQNDMKPFYRRATVLVRLVQHDGTGLTAVEALSLERHVIYSHPLPYTLRVAWGDSDALIEALTGLLNLHNQCLLRPNAAGRAYVEEHFNHHARMEDLISYFLEITANRRNRRLKLNGR